MAAAKKPRARKPKEAQAQAQPEVVEEYVPKVHTYRAGVPDGSLTVGEIRWQLAHNPLYQPTEEEAALLAQVEAEEAKEAAEANAKLAAELEAASQAAAEEEQALGRLAEVLEGPVEA